MELINLIQQLAQNVYNELGNGHSEAIYHKAMLYELRINNIPYDTELIVPIYYKNHNVGFIRCDILVDKKLILELKATDRLVYRDLDTEVVQTNKYMALLNISQGLIINFSKKNTVIFKYLTLEEELPNE